MKRLLKFLKKYIAECILGPLLKLMEAAMELIVPLIVALIIDNDIPAADGKSAAIHSAILAGFGIVGLAVSVTAQYFSAKAAVGFAADLRYSLFEKIQTLSYSDIDSVGTSALITRMTSDVNTLQNGVNLFLRLFLRSPFIVLGAAVMAFFVDVKLALIFVVAIPLLAIVVFGIMLASLPLYKRVQKKLERVLGLTQENISGARVIRAFCSEEEEKESFILANNEMCHLQKRVGWLSALTNPLTYIIINGAIIALIYFGALRVDVGLISVGGVVALYNYMSQILIELIKLANVIVSLTRSFACGERVAAVLEMPVSVADNGDDNAFDGKVCFKRVSMQYKGAGDKCLENISFVANKGDTVGIIGSTGSGKTSLVNLIGGYYYPTEGAVAVDGVDTRLWRPKELRAKVGAVFQKAVLFKGTVRDNLLWGNETADDEALDEALRAAQAYDFVYEKEGLDTEVRQGGKNFSGGQRQRLTIARALVRRPEILILDDAGSALDYATDAAMRVAVSKLSYNPTVFIVSQRASSVMNADAIVVLDDGAAVGVGTHNELLESCQVYKEIYRTQFEEGGKDK